MRGPSSASSLNFTTGDEDDEVVTILANDEGEGLGKFLGFSAPKFAPQFGQRNVTMPILLRERGVKYLMQAFAYHLEELTAGGKGALKHCIAIRGWVTQSISLMGHCLSGKRLLN